jgi:hypothetical protein
MHRHYMEKEASNSGEGILPGEAPMRSFPAVATSSLPAAGEIMRRAFRAGMGCVQAISIVEVELQLAPRPRVTTVTARSDRRC